MFPFDIWNVENHGSQNATPSLNWFAHGAGGGGIFLPVATLLLIDFNASGVSNRSFQKFIETFEMT